MGYVEFLRVRRAFVIYASIVALVALAVFASVESAIVGAHGVTLVVGGDTHGTAVKGRVATLLGSVSIPLGIILGLAGYCAVVFATALASSLNKENDAAHASFIKPISRERLACTFVAADGAGILLAFVTAAGAAVASIAGLGLLGRIFVDGAAFEIGALGLGIAFMWYGVLQAITASYKGRGGTIVGFSWLVFIALPPLGSISMLGPLFSHAIYALNLVDPLAYVSSLSSYDGGSASVGSFLTFPLPARIALTWGIAAAGCAVAIVTWKRVEV